MSNHVHFILHQTRRNGISHFMRDLQSQHAREVLHLRQSDGHLWKHHYFALPLSPAHYRAALLYVEQNPVQARLVKRAQDYPYSSAAAHLAGHDFVELNHRRGFARVELHLKTWREAFGLPHTARVDWENWLNDPVNRAFKQDLINVVRVLGPDRLTPVPAHRLPLPVPVPQKPLTYLVNSGQQPRGRSS